MAEKRCPLPLNGIVVVVLERAFEHSAILLSEYARRGNLTM
jgi:hypothetical protein